MLAAESAFSMLQEGLKMENYWDSLQSSWIWEELYTARNYRPVSVVFQKPFRSIFVRLTNHDIASSQNY